MSRSPCARPRARRVSAARGDRHRGAVELPDLARADAARDRPRRGQPRHDQAVGDHAGDERVLVGLVTETFSEDEVAVVTGDASTGAAFAALPFDHLFFTGSTAVGRAVMRAASEHLVPVTLELGGKSPVLVDRGQPLERVAADVAYGKLANAGQTCVAPDYALVHEADVDGFVEAWGKAVAALYPEGPASQDYTSIVNVRHYDRLRGLLDDAQAKGARVVETGPSPGRAKGRAHTLPPTLVLNVHDDMRIMQEEIFGPLLPIVTSRSGRGDRLRERSPAPARALLLRSSAANRRGC